MKFRKDVSFSWYCQGDQFNYLNGKDNDISVNEDEINDYYNDCWECQKKIKYAYKRACFQKDMKDILK